MGGQPLMAWFNFRAARLDGSILTGTVEADGTPGLRERLIARGLYPLSISPAARGAPPRALAGRRDLALLFRSLSSLVAVGVPIDRAIAASIPICPTRLGSALADLQAELAAGSTLSTALERVGHLVPPVALGMLRAGERGGRLGIALQEVATHLEAEAELLAQIRQALAYPAVLTLVGASSVLLITTVILPRFAALLTDAGADLPPTTALLIATSSFIGTHWLTLVLATIAMIVAALSWVRRPAARLQVHRMLLDTPLIGAILFALASSRVAHALAGMVGSGLPILPALRSAGDAAGNDDVRLRLARAGERVARGEPLARALSAESALGTSAIQLIAVGEASGQLATMTARAGVLMAQDADRSLRTLVGMLEPALVITFGGLVALVAAALLQAVYGLRPVG